MKSKRRRRKIGISLALLLIALYSTAAPAQRKSAAPATYGIIAGSIFQESGFALPGAQVTLIPDFQTSASQGKLKKLESVSDPRGEFVLRVPPQPMHYIVKVRAKGYQSQEKPVELHGEERVDVTFQMERESKK